MKAIFSIPVTTTSPVANMPFYLGSAIQLHSTDVVIFNEDDVRNPEQAKLLAKNGKQVNHKFAALVAAGTLTLSQVLTQIREQMAAGKQLKEVEPVVAYERVHTFGGIYAHIPKRYQFQLRHVAGEAPTLTMVNPNGKPTLLTFGEVCEFIQQQTTSELGGRRIGGDTVRIDSAVGEVKPLLVIMQDYIDRVKAKPVTEETRPIMVARQAFVPRSLLLVQFCLDYHVTLEEVLPLLKDRFPKAPGYSGKWNVNSVLGKKHAEFLAEALRGF